ncbi:CoA transferase subunit A [Alicyclobacillus macrosporangiidus]|uniref:3-oxoacid CoA-transferase subunit A/3-oxoadipate CoA-transferase, alpha subunit n=1 Tax=Alicyclobacillus macrosporangiidus TaxID=392015 RepID=A0A1I7GVG9_9BACL|nr:CoA transferase subunit A [Alicyclobacillus macrosporangiidus]SFU52444.1 3-oxoacid CoA-transferase subunit A/3-oxoadipate CoA-transferase, alpha subunit [Alicyclobacillus macrosporangiidus]
MKQKILSKSDAIARIRDGMSIMVGGFGLVGAPLELIDELYRQGQKDLTVISNNVGEPGKGLSRLLEAGRIRKAIGSYFTSNPVVGEHVLAGKLEVELMPQGTFVEAIRAGGAGIGGFYTRASAGTLLAEGKETRVIGGQTYVLEYALTADVALIRAHKADRLGNLVYRKTARNFNPVMATAAKLVIAEVDEIVEVGQMDPEVIVTPHLYVDIIVQREGAT